MTNEIWITVLGLGFISFLIRVSGFILASQIPKYGAWARGLEALPGWFDRLAGHPNDDLWISFRMDYRTYSIGHISSNSQTKFSNVWRHSANCSFETLGALRVL